MEQFIPVISLFSGAGGLDLGAHAAGCHARVCIDNDPDSTTTLRSNPQFKETVVLTEDILSLSTEQILEAAKLSVGETGILIGGPPCQPFSKAAYWTSTGEDAQSRRERSGLYSATGDIAKAPPIGNLPRQRGKARDVGADPRASLVDEFSRVLREAKPAGFVFENVMSITHPSNRSIFNRFLENARQAGYATSILRANAVEFGVPQSRKRIFVLGLRGRAAPNPPDPTHAATFDKVSEALMPPVTTGEAILRFNTAEYAETDEVVTGRWANHLHEIPPGRNYKALTAWAGHQSPTFVAETRFWSFLLKLHPDLPAWTIAANPGPWVGPFHWDSRRLRLPELAALQAFPENYQFVGNKRSIRRQIGNAVPPLLAQRVLEAVVSPLTGSSEMLVAAKGYR